MSTECRAAARWRARLRVADVGVHALTARRAAPRRDADRAPPCRAPTNEPPRNEDAKKPLARSYHQAACRVRVLARGSPPSSHRSGGHRVHVIVEQCLLLHCCSLSHRRSRNASTTTVTRPRASACCDAFRCVRSAVRQPQREPANRPPPPHPKDASDAVCDNGWQTGSCRSTRRPVVRSFVRSHARRTRVMRVPRAPARDSRAWPMRFGSVALRCSAAHTHTHAHQQ